MTRKFNRIVCWYSCGITSAVATKIILDEYREQYPIVIAYCDTGSEHPDNDRFIRDCERWYDFPITRLKNPKYETIWDTFSTYLVGIRGANCSLQLKKKVRQSFEDIENDLQVFGFDYKERKRANRFLKNNPEVNLYTPLIDKKMTKSDCLKIVQSVGIEIPMMYKLGYKNNNCIGCVKGAKGYWNKIRKDFPEVFERMSKEERRLGVRINQITENGVMRRVYLDELPPDAGNYKSELPISCGLLCE